MNVLVILALIFLFPFLCFLVFLALSSCLGDRFRASARILGHPVNPGRGAYAYDQTYFRTMTNSGPTASEHIEMETMLNKSIDRKHDEDL